MDVNATVRTFALYTEKPSRLRTLLRFQYSLRGLFLFITGYVVLWSATIYWGERHCEEHLAVRIAQPCSRRVPYAAEDAPVRWRTSCAYPATDSYAVGNAGSPCPFVVRVDFYRACPSFVAGGRQYFMWVFGYSIPVKPLREAWMTERMSAGPFESE